MFRLCVVNEELNAHSVRTCRDESVGFDELIAHFDFLENVNDADCALCYF